jgi:hypothetical protein
MAELTRTRRRCTERCRGWSGCRAKSGLTLRADPLFAHALTTTPIIWASGLTVFHNLEPSDSTKGTTSDDAEDGDDEDAKPNWQAAAELSRGYNRSWHDVEWQVWVYALGSRKIVVEYDCKRGPACLMNALAPSVIYRSTASPTPIDGNSGAVS